MNSYFNFLLQLIGENPDNPLLYYLFEVDYIWTIPLDINRAQDGIDLRCLWANLTKLETYDTVFKNKKCSMLEMLIAFAIRIENDFMGDTGVNKSSEWFHLMITNLGIHDDLYNFDRGRVDHALLYFFNHQISLFKVPNFDLTGLQLWDQMNMWLNYNIFKEA